MTTKQQAFEALKEIKSLGFGKLDEYKNKIYHLGNSLKYYRHVNGISLKTISEKSGIKTSTIKLIEDGAIAPDEKIIESYFNVK